MTATVMQLTQQIRQVKSATDLAMLAEIIEQLRRERALNDLDKKLTKAEKSQHLTDAQIVKMWQKLGA